MALALDRKAFIEIINEGVEKTSAPTCCRRRTASGACRRTCCRRCPAMVPRSGRTGPRPARSWRSSATGRTSGCAIKVSTRNIPAWRDPAVVLISQLREIYIDAELDLVDTARLVSEDVQARTSPSARCRSKAASTIRTRCSTRTYYSGAARNYAGYSDPETDKLIDQQSMRRTRRSARRSSGRSSAGWRRPYFRPVAFYPAARAAFSLGSRA